MSETTTPTVTKKTRTFHPDTGEETIVVKDGGKEHQRSPFVNAECCADKCLDEHGFPVVVPAHRDHVCGNLHTGGDMGCGAYACEKHLRQIIVGGSRVMLCPACNAANTEAEKAKAPKGKPAKADGKS